MHIRLLSFSSGQSSWTVLAWSYAVSESSIVDMVFLLVMSKRVVLYRWFDVFLL